MNENQPQPEFDRDGYPTDKTLKAIEEWPINDALGWLKYIEAAWDHHYGSMWVDGRQLKMATGGWSANESVISAMRRNFVLWNLFWESSHRGGLEVLRLLDFDFQLTTSSQ